MASPSTHTKSLCPYCFRSIPAQRISTDEATYLSKSCPEHGDLGKTLIWKNHSRAYSDWIRSPENVSGHPAENVQAAENKAPTSGNCPYECGLCADHRQATCSAILEVTRHCDMDCRICFASADSDTVEHPELSQIEEMFLAVRDSAGFPPIQLSGGEPTSRNDLPRIILLARKIGFDHIQVNTNGVRLAEDADFANALKDAGVSDFFLQFDGTTDEVYAHIRRKNLLSTKLKALERCAELEIGTILVPTVVKNINDHQIGTIIGLAKEWIPTVRGVHFQPITFLGRYPSAPHNEDRVLIPDILDAIEAQTGGELKVDHFIPPG